MKAKQKENKNKMLAHVLDAPSFFCFHFDVVRLMVNVTLYYVPARIYGACWQKKVP